MRKNHTLRNFLAFSAVFSASLANAQLAFSNFGTPAPGYLTGQGITISSDPTFGDFRSAAQFSPSITGAVSDITVAIGHFQGPQSIEMRLLADNSNLPGATLGIWSLSGLMPGFPTTRVTSVAATGPVITAGTKYWVELRSTNINTLAAWNNSTTNVPGLFAQTPTGAANYSSANPYAGRGAFSVSVNAVPEPASMAALGLGVVALVRRKKTSKS